MNKFDLDDLAGRRRPLTLRRLERIRRLNDLLRVQRRGGTVVLTRGVTDLGTETVIQLLSMIATFDEFDVENDPYSERDFGSVTLEEKKVFFKIDYYDRSLRMHSPDPADPQVTARVMTVMLTHEY